MDVPIAEAEYHPLNAPFKGSCQTIEVSCNHLSGSLPLDNKLFQRLVGQLALLQHQLVRLPRHSSIR